MERRVYHPWTWHTGMGRSQSTLTNKRRTTDSTRVTESIFREENSGSERVEACPRSHSNKGAKLSTSFATCLQPAQDFLNIFLQTSPHSETQNLFYMILFAMAANEKLNLQMGVEFKRHHHYVLVSHTDTSASSKGKFNSFILLMWVLLV